MDVFESYKETCRYKMIWAILNKDCVSTLFFIYAKLIFFYIILIRLQISKIGNFMSYVIKYTVNVFKFYVCLRVEIHFIGSLSGQFEFSTHKHTFKKEYLSLSYKHLIVISKLGWIIQVDFVFLNQKSN